MRISMHCKNTTLSFRWIGILQKNLSTFSNFQLVFKFSMANIPTNSNSKYDIQRNFVITNNNTLNVVTQRAIKGSFSISLNICCMLLWPYIAYTRTSRNRFWVTLKWTKSFFWISPHYYQGCFSLDQCRWAIDMFQ